MAIPDEDCDEDKLTQPATNGHSDAPPSYETISPAHNGQLTHLVDEKLPRQSTAHTPHNDSLGSSGARVDTPARSVSGHSESGPSSWLPWSPFTSWRASKQVQQTVTVLIRDLVLNAESPNLLGSCADACQNYGLDLSALLQERSIENHSAIYWAILNRRDALLPSLLVFAAPLSKQTMSDICLACLTTSNQHLFQSLRCQREPFTKQMTPLSTGPSADTLILGSMPADEVSIREMGGQGAFVAQMRINLWQKRMRVSGRVHVEFIARGRIWSLIFFSSPATAHSTAGVWKVALSLLEHSPPTPIDSRLVIDASPSSSNMSQASDPTLSSSPPDNALQPIQVRLWNYRLAYHAPPPGLDIPFLSQKDWTPPNVEQWSDNGGGPPYASAIIAPLNTGASADLMYGDTPYIAADGALHVRLEARLATPGSHEAECVVC